MNDILLIRKPIIGGVEASILRQIHNIKVCVVQRNGSDFLDTVNHVKLKQILNNTCQGRIHIVGIPMLFLASILGYFVTKDLIFYLHDSKLSNTQKIVLFFLTSLNKRNLVINYPNEETRQLYTKYIRSRSFTVKSPKHYRATNIKKCPVTYSSPSNLNFAIIGRCSPEKNPDYVFKLLTELEKTGVIGEVNFFGEGWDKLQSKGSKKFKYHGQVELHDEIFLNNDVFLCCSLREAFGLVQVEVVDANCILFSTNVGMVGKFCDNRKLLSLSIEVDTQNIINFLSLPPNTIVNIISQERNNLVQVLEHGK